MLVRGQAYSYREREGKANKSKTKVKVVCMRACLCSTRGGRRKSMRLKPCGHACRLEGG